MRNKFNSLRSRAKRRNLEVGITFEEYRQLKISDCHYCGMNNMFLKYYCEVMNIGMPYMSIDRKDNNRGYSRDNVVACCFLCNKIKGSFFTSEEMKKIGEQFIAPKFKVFEKEACEAFEDWCEYNVFTDDESEDFDTEFEIDLD